ncbi:hypothetical protein LIER_38109 [Lithospermum erythrorhizon]|uniref:MULE transposase domain-containing protein n=1 Tax=Lithospermum erythrorhizon TaxID=34254 RepID=A0AAV3PZB2_LITER
MNLKLGQHVIESNRATKYYVKIVDIDDGKPEFQRWYICWKACIEGFKSGCRKLVGVDGCHLKTKRGGHLLVAVGIDPNNNIFPIAYGVDEVDNKKSWEWFMFHLSEDLRDNGEDDDGQDAWTFMSDKQKGLIEAFKNVLPNVDHRFYVRHLHENFKRAGFKETTYMDALWSAVTSTTTQYYEDAMDKMK